MNRYSILSFILLGPFLIQLNAIEISYEVSFPQPTDHYIHIEINISQVSQESLQLQMPAWSPGKYQIYDFAQNVRDFSVKSSNERIPTNKLDKLTWNMNLNGSDRITVNYKVYSNNLSGDFSFLSDTHAFLDGASLYMYVVGHKDKPVTLTIRPPTGWKILSSGGDLGTRNFSYPNYDLMIDDLVQLGDFELHQSTIDGINFRVSIVHEGDESGIPEFVDNIMKISRAETELFHPLDTNQYTFFFHFLPESRFSVGMEHFNCCQMTRIHDLPGSAQQMKSTYLVSAHELVHAWNVKRLRPKPLGPFDYTKEVHTELLWFAEGITSYIADLTMLQSEIWDKETFLNHLSYLISVFRNDPGIRQRSPEEASFDTWFWRQYHPNQASDWENNFTSYYISGEVLGLCIDLEIRNLTNNEKSFMDFFNLLYERNYQNADAENYYYKGKGYTTEDIFSALEDTTNSSWDSFYTNYIASPGDYPIGYYLSHAGLNLEVRIDNPPTPYTGLHLVSTADGLPQIFGIDSDSPSLNAGLMVDDIIVSLDGEPVIYYYFNDVLRRNAEDEKVLVSLQRDNRTLEILMNLSKFWILSDYNIIDADDPSEKALRIRNSWLSPKTK
jgi:predicted metalloprotease with PDZ domain